MYLSKHGIGAEKLEKVRAVVNRVAERWCVKLALLLHYPVLLALDLVLPPVSA